MTPTTELGVGIISCHQVRGKRSYPSSLNHCLHAKQVQGFQDCVMMLGHIGAVTSYCIRVGFMGPGLFGLRRTINSSPTFWNRCGVRFTRPRHQLLGQSMLTRRLNTTPVMISMYSFFPALPTGSLMHLSTVPQTVPKTNS